MIHEFTGKAAIRTAVVYVPSPIALYVLVNIPARELGARISGIGLGRNRRVEIRRILRGRQNPEFIRPWPRDWIELQCIRNRDYRRIGDVYGGIYIFRYAGRI